MSCSLSGTPLLTNTHEVRGRPTLKDVERQFRNGSFREPEKCYMSSKIELNAQSYTIKIAQISTKQNVNDNVKHTQVSSSCV